MMKDRQQPNLESPDSNGAETGHRDSEVRSSIDIALERAAQLEDEPIAIETEDGPVEMTFQDLRDQALMADDYRTKLQYLQAEFDNYRKRTQREKEERAAENVSLRDLLEILDHLDLALNSGGDEQSIRDGVALIRGQLWKLLADKGVEPVPGQGEPFDPNFHEAMTQQPHPEVPSGHIAEEFQTGFRLGNRLLRPSKVVVSSGPA